MSTNQKPNAQAEFAVSATLTQLLLQQPWFAQLAMRLEKKEAPGLGTVATDGRSFFYDPEFFLGLSTPHRQAVMGHEVLHCVFRHFSKARMGSRSHHLWNMAGDFVINLELKECGFEFPGQPFGLDDFKAAAKKPKVHEKGGGPQIHLYDQRFAGMLTEEVYAILDEELPEEFKQKQVCVCVRPAQEGDGEGKEKGGSSGLSLDQEWELATAAATLAAEQAGKIPASVRRLVEALKPKVDWRPVVHRYLTRPGDSSWTKPNRRFVSSGLYLPGSVIDSLDTLVIAVDTSGSVSERMLQVFGGEANGVLGAAGWPRRVVVLYCDAQVNAVDEVEGEIQLRAVGGGGTAFQPVFDWVEQEGLEPDVLFYLTDLEGPPAQPVPYPVVWVTPIQYKNDGPFGETIRIDVEA